MIMIIICIMISITFCHAGRPRGADPRDLRDWGGRQRVMLALSLLIGLFSLLCVVVVVVVVVVVCVRLVLRMRSVLFIIATVAVIVIATPTVFSNSRH